MIKEVQKMKKNAITVIIFIMLISIIVLPASADNKSRNVDIISNENEIYYSSKVFLFGIIKETHSTNITSFTTVCVFAIVIKDCNGTKTSRVGISKNAQMDFPMKLYRFRGILLKHFICGVFQFPKVSASPASLPFNIPAEVELTVTSRGIGLENIWVSIIIPGLQGEMNTTTNANGKATFAFTPPTTGNVTIKIENNTIPITIKVTA
jgi:hypothetical protein